jgi:hypothetical protein
MDSAGGLGKPRPLAVQPLLPEAECEGAANVFSQTLPPPGTRRSSRGRVNGAPTFTDSVGFITARYKPTILQVPRSRPNLLGPRLLATPPINFALRTEPL